MKDQPAASSDQTKDAFTASAEVWRNIAAEQDRTRNATASDSARTASPQMLAMEDSGALPNLRTSC